MYILSLYFLRNIASDAISFTEQLSCLIFRYLENGIAIFLCVQIHVQVSMTFSVNINELTVSGIDDINFHLHVVCRHLLLNFTNKKLSITKHIANYQSKKLIFSA